VIAAYQAPTISTNNYTICSGGSTIDLIPDSSKGVVPYQYEIISGPQIYPIQSSNIFSVATPGVYQVRISDVCGNANTDQVTIDTISFTPVNTISNTCNSTKLFFGSSVYSTYKWTKPSGAIYTGDTLIIDPITPADTGTYNIQDIVNINGCTNTLNNSYHLSLISTYQQTIPFCNGTVVHVGTKTYTLPGIYTDTLTNINALGCDSIVITSLIAMQKKDTNNITVCNRGSITVGTNTYNATGFYEDSVLNAAGCYDLIFTNLTVDPVRDSVSIFVGNNDSTINPEGTVDLMGITNDIGGAYLWTATSGSISDPYSLVTQAIPGTNSSTVTYTLQVTNTLGCKDSAQRTVAISNATDCTIKTYNAFTPNGDGYNDVWIIFKPACVQQVQVDVYNRWGSLVYHSDNYNNDWNGEYQNKKLPDATYYYVVQPIYFDGRRPVLKGSVTILR
jgi:gliding motility-associated-like protein